VSPNLTVPDSALRFTQALSVRLRDQDAELPLDRLADLTYQQRALYAMGGELRAGR
jgi:hypothetical protein